MTVEASTPGSDPCSSYPELGVGAPLDQMVIESIEICGTFAGDPAPFERAYRLEDRDQAWRQV